jgi:hypothetical protein
MENPCQDNQGGSILPLSQIRCLYPLTRQYLNIPVANVTPQDMADNWLEIIDNVENLPGKFIGWIEPQKSHRLEEQKQPKLLSVFQNPQGEECNATYLLKEATQISPK